MKHPRISGNCPLESKIAFALDDAGIPYSVDGEPENKTGLDFCIPSIGVFIEVKSGPTPRVLKQLERRSNVIVVQGVRSTNLFCHLLRNQKPVGEEQTS